MESERWGRLASTASLAVAVSLVAGCSESSTAPAVPPIVGSWFGCDISDCTVLDDDGYEFTEAGEVYRIEEALRLPGPGCETGGCFSADAPSVTITRNLVGSYTFDDPSLTLSIDTCTDTTEWTVTGDVSRLLSSCDGDYGADDQYLRFGGTIVVQ